ncbi:MAG TPA: hypothetical protein VF223_13945 [Trebonia sp.]
MTGRLGELAPARAVIPPGTRVHVGFTGGQDLTGRASTVRAVKRSGFVPVPVIAARRLRSEAMLREYLDTLQAADASGSVFVVAGHPGGHPAADDKVPWSALAGKAAALEQRGLGGSVVTQFGFDPELVLVWVAGVRERDISLPVRVGVPGPASTRLLLSYASRCGVSVSAPVAREYGLSRSGPAATAAPDRFIRALASGYDPRVHGEMKLHFNPFGGFRATAEWATQFRRSAGTSGGAL